MTNVSSLTKLSQEIKERAATATSKEIANMIEAWIEDEMLYGYKEWRSFQRKERYYRRDRVSKLPISEAVIKLRIAGYLPSRKFSVETITKAKRLHDSGLSLREIAKELGIHHPQTVKNMLMRWHEEHLRKD